MRVRVTLRVDLAPTTQVADVGTFVVPAHMADWPTDLRTYAHARPCRWVEPCGIS